MRRSSNPNPNAVGFRQSFANPKSDAFWKNQVHHLSNVVSHTKVKKYTEFTYVRTD